MENEIKNDIKVETKYCGDIAVLDKAQKQNKIKIINKKACPTSTRVSEQMTKIRGSTDTCP